MPCQDVAREIMSYLDYESLLAARMVSKDWYKFLEKQRSNIWVQKMWIKYETSLRSRNPDLYSVKVDWKELGRKIEKNGTVADIVSFVPKLAKATFEEYPLETIQVSIIYNVFYLKQSLQCYLSENLIMLCQLPRKKNV